MIDALRLLQSLLVETFAEWREDKASRLGAALAYYSVFSLGPLLILVTAIAGLCFGEQAVRGELVSQLDGLLGETAARAVERLLAGASQPTAGALATMVGIVTLLIGATAVVVELKDALDTIWDVKPKAGLGVRTFLRKYVVSLAAVIALGFLLTVSLVVTTALSAIGKRIGISAGVPESWLELANSFVSFAGITLLFALIFKVIPDVKIRWSDVWPGSVVTGLLFLGGKFLVGFYLGRRSLESTYGAAASVIVLLVWIYYSAQIVFFGAEFTQVYVRRLRGPAEPETFAESAVASPVVGPPAASLAAAGRSSTAASGSRTRNVRDSVKKSFTSFASWIS